MPDCGSGADVLPRSSPRSQHHAVGARKIHLSRLFRFPEPTLEGTFYAWKSKYGGLTVSDVKRLKALEDENARLKKLLPEQMLDAAAMKELLVKKWWDPP
jgi:hypothetical protein